MWFPSTSRLVHANVLTCVICVAREFERTNYALDAELPEMADPASLAAKLENGVLTVTVKKRAETQAKTIAIE